MKKTLALVLALLLASAAALAASAEQDRLAESMMRRAAERGEAAR